MTSAVKSWLKRLAVWLLLATFFLLAVRFIAGLVGIGLGISILLLELAGSLLLLVGIPFFIWVIGERALRIFIEPYFRAWHIHRIRNARFMKEAIQRGRSGE